jgi:hypothetical protein
MASFKIIFSADNIRRFRTESVPDFEKFVRLLSTQYPLYFHPELRIQYVDTENDKIDITSELEWREMFEELKNEKIIKIYIVDGPVRGGYFKDGPPSESLYFYEKPVNNQTPTGRDDKPHPIADEMAELRSRVPRCLQELFPQKHILPYHLPAYLQKIIKVTKVANHPQNEVEIDIDVTQLHDVIHRQAMTCLDLKDYTQGRDLFRALCVLEPAGVNCHYNLACAEALLGNIPDALTALRKAVDLGWSDLRHTLNDEDLVALRNTEEFDQICSEMANRLGMTEKPSKNYSAPVIPEEPVVPVTNSYEPLPVVPPQLGTDESKWEVQLGLLHDFGFLNNSLLVPFLEKNEGSVERTVLDLLDI